MNARNIDGFTRISKATARKLYNMGRRIYLLPVNLRFDMNGHWYMPYEAYKGGYNAICTPNGYSMVVPYDEFNKTVNWFEYYNCNREAGKYSAFYVRDEREA